MIYYCRGSFGNNSCHIWGAKMVTSLVAAPFSAHVAQLDFFYKMCRFGGTLANSHHGATKASVEKSASR